MCGRASGSCPTIIDCSNGSEPGWSRLRPAFRLLLLLPSLVVSWAGRHTRSWSGRSFAAGTDRRRPAVAGFRRHDLLGELFELTQRRRFPQEHGVLIHGILLRRHGTGQDEGRQMAMRRPDQVEAFLNSLVRKVAAENREPNGGAMALGQAPHAIRPIGGKHSVTGGLKIPCDRRRLVRIMDHDQEDSGRLVQDSIGSVQRRPGLLRRQGRQCNGERRPFPNM